MVTISKIKISINNRNIAYYKKLGYKIRGKNLIVKIKDLPPNAKGKIPCKCNRCGKNRLIYIQQYRDYCKKCAGIIKCSGVNHHLYGKHQSEETKEKLRLANIGRKTPESVKEKLRNYCGTKHSMYGKPKSQITKEKISKTLMGRFRGKESPVWNPKKTDKERQDDRKYPEYANWRKAVYARDNYTCKKCKKRGYKLEAHHIENYLGNKKLRLIIENGITLCKKCHKEFHKKYGLKLNNRQQIKEFIKWKN